MNTFQRHFEKFNAFVERIMASQPDYLVPVAKKGCKLLKSADVFTKIPSGKIRYRTFFEYEQVPLRGKRIAVLDDATQYTASLMDHRSFFESQGAIVTTNSFVGHESLFTGERERYDGQSNIGIYLREPVYQEYIIQQSYHLLRSGQHFDLDHLVFALPADAERVRQLVAAIEHKGYLLRPDDSAFGDSVQRFALDTPGFFGRVPFLSFKGIEIGPIRKIKFAYEAHQQTLLFSPLVFPTWYFGRAEYGAGMFADAPFELPFPTPTLIDRKNPNALRRAYFNICVAHAVALAKAFVQELPDEWDVAAKLTMRDYDLSATIGENRAKRLTSAVSTYLRSDGKVDFTAPLSPVVAPTAPRYNDFAGVVDDLKIGYERVTRRHGTRLGVHYVVPYDKLFEQFPDRQALSENIDLYCDFGALVPETIVETDRITRGCRSGEPKIDLNWDRTRALIPFAIHEFTELTRAAEPVMKPMTLHKLLANFSYDYPHQHYPELHCLLGEPHTYGTMMRVYHHLRAPSKPTIYDYQRIGTNYTYDGRRRVFVANNRNDVVALISRRFDEQQEVPYTTIYTYLAFLAEVYELFGNRVDVLNLLSVCREPNYFYTHVTYNVRAALEAINTYEMSLHTQPDTKGLHDAGNEANSGLEKVRLFRRSPEVIEKITEHFAGRWQFLKVLERVKEHHYPPDAAFLARLDAIEELLVLERVTANFGLLVESAAEPSASKHVLKYQKTLHQLLEGRTALAPDINVDVPPGKESPEYAEQLQQLIERICARIESLPAEEPLLATRLTADALRRAKNSLTRIVYDENYTKIVLLFIDLSGLRTIPEPKEGVVAEFYRIVDMSVGRRGGRNLYGGKGGDDAYTILFRDPGPAIECARDIKREFAGNLFLAGRLDVKFGISFTVFTNSKREHEAILTWGEAKDCCEYKSPTFRNRGDVLVSARTLRTLREEGHIMMADQFTELGAEKLKGEEPQQLYKLQALP